MFPEAGGSSSLRAARVQRVLVVLRRLGGDAHLHGHDRHLGVLRPALHRRRVRVRRGAAARAPATSSRRCVVIALLAAVNVFGAKESTGINVTLAVVDFLTQLLLVLVGAVLVFSTRDARRQRPLRRRADLERLHPRDPDRHARLHGHRDGLEHGRGGQGRGHDDPGGDQPRAARRLRDLLHAARGRALRAAGHAGRDGEYQTRLGLTEEEGGFAGDPVLGVVKQIDLGPFQGVDRGLRRPARRDDPLPRHERGHHRRLAARLLDGHPPPDARRAAPPAPALPHAVDRHPRLRRRRDRADPARARRRCWAASTRSARCSRSRWRTRPWRGCAPSGPTSSGPTAGRATCASAATTRRCSRSSAARSPRSPSSSSSSSTRAWRRSASAGCSSACSSTRSTAAARGSTSPRRTRSRSPQPVVDHEAEYDSVLVHIGDADYDEQLVATAVKLAARKRRGIHILVTITVPNALLIDADDARGGGGRRLDHRAGQAARRRPRLRPLGEGPRRPGRAADHRGGAATCARPPWSWALPRRVSGYSVFGKTLETVLAERPCRVIIESPAGPPARVPRRKAGAGVSPLTLAALAR